MLTFELEEGIEEGSKNRYPPGVQAVKRHHPILERGDNIRLIPPSPGEAERDEVEAT